MYKFQVSAWRKLVFLLLLSACAVTGRAQIYPVQLSTLVSPPYSIYLPDYASPGGEKLRLVLLQRDLTVQGYRVRFDMKIQVNGVTIMQTSRSAMPPPITLQPGIPTVLGGSDLSWYVQPQNLEFGGGYSSSTYEQSRSLPEGPITITFTAYDYIRSDLQVSAAAGSFFYATRDNPPLLNYPACGMQVTPINPQFLNFNWLPQNTSSPNSALQTNYIFSLWAVLPAGYNFQDIVQSTRPLYSVTTQMPTLVYGPGQPLLVPGQSYAWRVQAVDMTGRDIFRNNGYSETCNFIYGGDGTQGIVSYPGIQVNAASAGPAQGKVWWTGAGASGTPGSGSGLAASGYDQYRLYYRKVQGNYDWFSVDVNDSMYRIFDLEPSTTYECRLQGHKNGSYGPYTDVINFTTDAPKTIGCTDNTSMLNAYSGRPLAVATPAMNITYGPWDVELLTVQPLGSPGRFKGTCKVTVPFMGSMTFNAKFDNLTIDDSRNVTAGNIDFLSQGLQAWIDSSIHDQMGGGSYGKVASGTDTTNVTVRVNLANLDHLDVVDSSNGDIKTIMLPDNSTVTVPDGMQELTIKDASGSTYSLDNQGNLTQLSLSDPSLQNFFADPANVAGLNSLAGGVGTVTFKDIPDAKFAFDAWKPFYGQASTILTGQYEKLTGPNGDYYVPQKAIGAGESDLVGLDIDLPDNMDEDSLIFVTGTGTRLIWDPNDYTLNLLGGPAADAQEIYALYPKPGGGYYSLAKLLVSSYEHQDFTAVVVPVVAGDEAVPHIDVQKYSDSLNSIYNKVNISWTVIPDSAYRNTSWDAGGDGKLTMTGSSFLSNTLTGEPAALIRNYSKQRPVDNSKKYIFVLNTSGGSADDPGAMAGDMPRGTQYGFIFLDQSGDAGQTAVTIAHELGHGQFNLEHTFSGDVALGGQGATKDFPNLMDYQVGSYVHLYKYQWNQVHQPGQVMGVLEGDKAGESLGTPYLKCICDADVIAGLGKKFYDPAGNVIQLSDNMTPYAFFGSKEGDLYGNLAAFKMDGQTYLYLLYNSGEHKGEYGNVFGTIDGSGKIIPAPIVHDIAQSVKIDNNNTLNGKTLAKCSCNDLATVIKPEGQVKVGAMTTGKVKKAGSDSTAAKDVMLCSDDPFNEPHQLLVQYADGTTTWGQSIVKQLNSAVDGNKKNNYGDDLLSAKLDGVSYLFPGTDYAGNSVFMGGYTKEELNNKMAFLEISKGYQFYTKFIQTNCTFTQQVADNFARTILDSSNVSKEKGIICLVLINGNLPVGDPQEFTIGMAFGTSVSEGNDIRKVMNATPGNVSKTIVSSLIDAYQLIPKKRIIHNYFIGKVTQRSIDWRQMLLMAGQGYKELKDTIWDKVDNKDNEPGNAIAAEYYIIDTAGGKVLNQIIDDKKALKEEYVTTESLNVGINYAVKYAGWDLMSWDGIDESISNSNPSVSPCHFTLGKPCAQEAADNAFFIATLVVPQRYALIPITAAVVYYSSIGQADEGVGYLVIYGLSEVAAPMIEFAAVKSASLIKLGTKKLKDLKVALELRKAVSEGMSQDAIQALFDKQLDVNCVEYMIPDADSKNLWIKMSGTGGQADKILVGTLEGQTLVVKGYKEGSNYIIESIDNIRLKQIAADVMELDPAIASLLAGLPNDIAAALKQAIQTDDKFAQLLNDHSDILKLMTYPYQPSTASQLVAANWDNAYATMTQLATTDPVLTEKTVYWLNKAETSNPKSPAGALAGRFGTNVFEPSLVKIMSDLDDAAYQNLVNTLQQAGINEIDGMQVTVANLKQAKVFSQTQLIPATGEAWAHKPDVLLVFTVHDAETQVDKYIALDIDGKLKLSSGTTPNQNSLTAFIKATGGTGRLKVNSKTGEALKALNDAGFQLIPGDQIEIKNFLIVAGDQVPDGIPTFVKIQ